MNSFVANISGYFLFACAVVSHGVLVNSLQVFREKFCLLVKWRYAVVCRSNKEGKENAFEVLIAEFVIVDASLLPCDSIESFIESPRLLQNVFVNSAVGKKRARVSMWTGVVGPRWIFFLNLSFEYLRKISESLKQAAWVGVCFLRSSVKLPSRP